MRRIEAKRLVFVDETGVNTAMTPTHAWCGGVRGRELGALLVGFDDVIAAWAWMGNGRR